MSTKALRFCYLTKGGRLAQLVEQLTLNQRVAGSNPAAPTTKVQSSPSFPLHLEMHVVLSHSWKMLLEVVSSGDNLVIIFCSTFFRNGSL